MQTQTQLKTQTTHQFHPIGATAKRGFSFTEAKRRDVWLKICLTGMAGSGKTYSGLILGTELAKRAGGKLCVLDTENQSAKLYSKQFDFLVSTMEPPYLTSKFIEAIDECEQAGVKVLMIDSLSAQWSALLDRKNLHDYQTKANSFTSWGPFGKEHSALIQRLCNSKLHIISTLRSKSDFVITQENGKSKPQKVGLACVQRDGFEFEQSIVIDMERGLATVSKDRTGLFKPDSHSPFQITAKTAESIWSWLHEDDPRKEVKHA